MERGEILKERWRAERYWEGEMEGEILGGRGGGRRDTGRDIER